jgi:hypothetical protein
MRLIHCAWRLCAGKPEKSAFGCHPPRNMKELVVISPLSDLTCREYQGAGTSSAGDVPSSTLQDPSRQVHVAHSRTLRNLCLG